MNINDFVQDFPSRCAAIFEKSYPVAKDAGFEVTATLCVAAAGMIIPHERLQVKHPFGDQDRFKKARAGYEEFCNKPFDGSSLAKDVTAWESGSIRLEWGNPNSWEDERDKIVFKAISKEKTVKGVIGILRNALAHGSIWTLPKREDEKTLTQLVFFSINETIPCDGFKDGTRVKFSCIRVSPAAFKSFLEEWFVFLKSLKL